MTTEAEEAAIRRVVAGISTAWRSGRIGELHDYFADDVVIVPPGAGHRVVGRGAVVETYREFAVNTSTEAYRETDLSIDVFADAAVATYRYEIDWIRDGAKRTETGSDVLFLSRRDATWRVVWRTIIPSH